MCAWPLRGSIRRARSSTTSRSIAFQRPLPARASIDGIRRFLASRNDPRPVTTYRAGFDAFWEIDVFGRVRSQVRAAAANAESFEADADDVRVSVAAEVARNYFEVRGLQQQLAVAERSLANQQRDAAPDAGPARRGHRRRAGRRERRGACRGDRGEHPADPKRDRAARASHRRADRASDRGSSVSICRRGRTRR